MKKLWLWGVVLLLGTAPVHALSGFREGYIWLTDMQTVGGTYVNPQLMCLKVDNTLTAVGGTYQLFSPAIPDNYVIPGHPSNQHGPGERAGLPTIYESSTADGYGVLLIGAYVDNSPAATRQNTNPPSQTMDILKLAPQSGGALTITTVHGGKADVSGQFHTEDATQALYDKDGLWTGTPNSVIVTGESRQMDSRTDGFATDVDGDGDFEGGTDTDTFVNQGNLYGKKVLYDNYLFGGAVGRYISGKYSGEWMTQVRRETDGTYSNTWYYTDNALQGGAVDLGGSSITTGPMMAVGDTNHNGVPDVYIALNRVEWDHDDNADTPNRYGTGIGHLEDKNDDGDAQDPGESAVFFRLGRQNDWDSPDIPGDTVFRPNGGAVPFGIVESDNGEFALLVYSSPGHWDPGSALFALGIADNGEWDGDYQVIATELSYPGNPTGAPIMAGINDVNYALWDPIAAEIPEPGTLLLLGTGMLTAVGYMRRRYMR